MINDSMYYMLVSLLDAPKCGYHLMRDIEVLSDGYERPAIATLYVRINRLLNEGAIERAGFDGRRKKYGVTPHGKRLIQVHTRNVVARMRVAQGLRLGVEGTR
jgi:DNA-binding PadR family transcriptional regulator